MAMTPQEMLDHCDQLRGTLKRKQADLEQEHPGSARWTADQVAALGARIDQIESAAYELLPAPCWIVSASDQASSQRQAC
jgi:hypothetical protein